LPAVPVLGALMLAAAGCGQPGSGDAVDRRLAELEARFTPGLHAMMVELGMRHASLWFAGDAENWALADYMAHELEEVAEHIREVHPEYDDVPVAGLMAQLTLPHVGEIRAAIEAQDPGAFGRAYDRLTASCNACHAASDRSAIVIQRPTAPPLTNLRYTRELQEDG
jgi:hypothetical protein